MRPPRLSKLTQVLFSPKKALSLSSRPPPRGRLPGLPPSKFILTQWADLRAQTHPSRLRSEQCALPRRLSACEPARRRLPHAEQVSQHRGWKLPRRPASASAAERANLAPAQASPVPAVPRTPGWGPRGRPGSSAMRAERAGRAGSSSSAPGPGPNGSPLVPAARSHGCHGRAAAAGEVSRSGRLTSPAAAQQQR